MKEGWGCNSVVGYLPSMRKTLGVPSPSSVAQKFNEIKYIKNIEVILCY
jgi:hypothetical protein